MDTCFLFTKEIDDNGCLCLKMSQNGELIAPPEFRQFAEIRTLQQESRTLIIESSANASLLSLSISWLPDRKARMAIPYALEDKLAQAVEELHFAFDKLRYQNNQYLITVIDKQRIKHLMWVLTEQQIDYELITLDWFALQTTELAIVGADLLVNNGDFKGALSGELAKSYIRSHTQDPVLSFKDSSIDVNTPTMPHETQSTTWIAERLLHAKPLNLCQGEMQHGTDSDWIRKGYILSAGLCGFWLLSLLIVNGMSLHKLNQQTAVIDKQIAVIYREFFPDAKQIISPKFRISQLLGNNSGDSQTHFWFLLNQFAKGMKNTKITIEQLRYQNKTLSVTLVSPDFNSLQDIENQFKKLQLKVKQTQASTKEQQVIATLELT